MLVYIFYLITFLFYLALFALNYSKPSLGGENAMGYGLGLFGLGLGYVLSSLVLTVLVAYKDGFDWIKHSRILLIGLAWLCMSASTLACTVFKWEWHDGEFPDFLRWIAFFNGQIWIPMLMFVPYFFLIMGSLRYDFSPVIYKAPLILGFCISAVMSLGILMGWLNSSMKKQEATLYHQIERDSQQQNMYLQEIANHKTSDTILNLLALTGRYQDNIVKEKAVLKVKEHSNWERELIDLLRDENYFYEVYSFLDGNKVDNPNSFIEPLAKSIHTMSLKIHTDIINSNNLQDWHFEHFGIERLLRSIDFQFSNYRKELKPSILELKASLQTDKPDRFKNVNLKVLVVLNDWIKSNI